MSLLMSGRGPKNGRRRGGGGSTPEALAAAEFARREALVFGDYEPSATTTGLLTEDNSWFAIHNGNYTFSGNGTTLENTIINGNVTFNGTNQTLRNCWVRGPIAGGGHMVNCEAQALTIFNAVIEDCLIVPQTVVQGVDGIRGWHLTAKRNRIYHTIDGFSVFRPAAAAGQGQVDILVDILGNWVSDLAKFCPEPGRNPQDGTHNDCIQHQGGSNVLIRGNRLQGTISQVPGVGDTGGFNTTQGPPECTVTANQQVNAGIILNDNASEPLNALIEDNWFYGGSTSINIRDNTLDQTQLLATIRNNRFDRTQWFQSPSPHAIVKFSANQITATGNTFMDNGAAVTVINV
jgi:hypothetical protein